MTREVIHILNPAHLPTPTLPLLPVLPGSPGDPLNSVDDLTGQDDGFVDSAKKFS